MQAYYFFMNSNRLQLLQEFYNEEPHDPFNVYALAMEYINNDVEQAKFYLDELLAKHPDYLPTYYHAAALYAEMGQKERVKSLYERGILLSLQQQQTRTYQELQRAFRAFQDEEDEE